MVITGPGEDPAGRGRGSRPRQRRWRRCRGGLAGLGLLALASALPACDAAGPAHTQLPDAAGAAVLAIPDADWTVRAPDGSALRLGDLAGEVVFVNLWATWCPPCVKEMPSIQALAAAFADEHVRFLVVSSEERVTVERFAEQQQFTLPFMLATTPPPAAFDSGGLIPATFILDRQGRVVYEHVGFRDWNAPDVHEFLRGLLEAEA